MAPAPPRASVRPDDNDTDDAMTATSFADIVVHLEPLQQKVVRLVYLEGRTYRETARILAVERGVVATTLAAAFRRIARWLAEQDADSSHR